MAELQAYYDDNLRVLREAVESYRLWYESGIGLNKWVKQTANPDPDTMRGEWVKKMVQSGQLPPGVLPEEPLDWSIKVALVSGSVVAFIIVLLWALGRAR